MATEAKALETVVTRILTTLSSCYTRDYIAIMFLVTLDVEYFVHKYAGFLTSKVSPVVQSTVYVYAPRNIYILFEHVLNFAHMHASE